MTRRYYSTRHRQTPITLETLYWKVQNLFLFYQNLDYFKERTGITRDRTNIPDSIIHKAAIALSFQPFPIDKWAQSDLTEDHVFDVLEFLFDHVSKPGELMGMTTDTGWNYEDYGNYDEIAGREEFRKQANSFLCDYRSGYELTSDGMVLAMGTQGLQYILDAEIKPYDEKNVDSKVRNAIAKWRNRHLSFDVKKEAIRELADVFEWLKKAKKLERALEKKDDSAIFDIANNFAIRHHDPRQKTGYDEKIWYAWMFHFYLATYHATVNLLLKEQQSKAAIKATKTQ